MPLTCSAVPIVESFHADRTPRLPSVLPKLHSDNDLKYMFRIVGVVGIDDDLQRIARSVADCAWRRDFEKSIVGTVAGRETLELGWGSS